MRARSTVAFHRLEAEAGNGERLPRACGNIVCPDSSAAQSRPFLKLELLEPRTNRAEDAGRRRG